jgi:glycosyltransferase involved in cell wall biosynthesis
MDSSVIKKKVLYVSPHLSTGGLPQYLLKKIETFNDQLEIYCVEYSYYGSAFVVQRNKICNILGDRFIELGDQKERLPDIIDSVSPDVVHFEEIAETFVDRSILNRIYRKDRSYVICETCHSSTIEPTIKTHKPDKFIMVSDWIKEKYRILGVPTELLEYPIDNNVPNKNLALEKLGLDPNKKHVVNVGLFTPGKNQGELIRYAQSLNSSKDFPIQFHFVGNQAQNFEFYWGPLMESLPSNCRIWGERNDVELFYQAADLFVFTSTYELNPLCLKEALSWKIPILFYNLHTYSDSYSREPLVNYLVSNNDPENINKILEILKIERPDANT